MGRVAIDWTCHGWTKGQVERQCGIVEIQYSYQPRAMYAGLEEKIQRMIT